MLTKAKSRPTQEASEGQAQGVQEASPSASPLLTNDERDKLLLRIAILEDMVAFLLGETEPTPDYERAFQRAEKIVNKSQREVRDILQRLNRD